MNDRSPSFCPNCGAELRPDTACVACARVRQRAAWRWVFWLVPVALIGVWLYPNIYRSNHRGQISSCESNEKNIGTAMEMYSTDNSGRYCRDMTQLTPNYLRVIPTCPSAGTDTYSKTLVSVAKPADAYTFYCAGANHTGLDIPMNFPQYNSTQGLVSGH